jgi:hypothetical protein
MAVVKLGGCVGRAQTQSAPGEVPTRSSAGRIGRAASSKVLASCAGASRVHVQAADRCRRQALPAKAVFPGPRHEPHGPEIPMLSHPARSGPDRDGDRDDDGTYDGTDDGTDDGTHGRQKAKVQGKDHWRCTQLGMAAAASLGSCAAGHGYAISRVAST